MNELKVGDVVSCSQKDENKWMCFELLSKEALLDLIENMDVIDWQRGIHPSLIPEGWQLVPCNPTDRMLYEMQQALLVYSLQDIEDPRMSRNVFGNIYKVGLEAAPKPEDC